MDRHIKKYTVSQLSNLIKKTLNDEFKNNIHVTGEISNLKKSGQHVFITLKDDTAVISVAFWNQSINHKNGDNVSIIGKIDYYGKNNNINLVGKTIEMIGIGSLHTQYENLKNKYNQMGYFDNRKELPVSAKNIGVITALGGAALQDFLHVLEKNNYSGNISIYDCSVQGPRCPETVSDGIKYFDTLDIDIIIITRGGGSTEDLMGFSDPRIIEAIHESKHYTISAVGHQIDNMLSDFVANYRAPTPSIAGEIVAKIDNGVYEKFYELENRIQQINHTLRNKLYTYSQNIIELKNQIIDPSIEIDNKLNQLMEHSYKHIHDKLSKYLQKINNFRATVSLTDSQSFLNQGFNLFLNKNGSIVTSINQILDKNITLVHSSGNYLVSVQKIT